MKSMIGLAAIAAAVIFARGSSAQSPQSDSWHTIQRMCGVLEHSNIVVDKRSGVSEDRKGPFRRVHLQLYDQMDSNPCCEGLALVAQAVTDWNGRFSFKKIPPGLYWLAFEFRGRTFSYPFRYEAVKHADPDCDSFYLDLDETLDSPLNRELVVE